MENAILRKIYTYTLFALPIVYIVFFTLTRLHYNTNIVFFIGHLINGPFVAIALILNYNKSGYTTLIKYGMLILFIFTIFTAVFSIRFNMGLGQSVFDTYPLLFVRVGMLIDIILFQMALLQNWHIQEKQLSIEKIKSQLTSEKIRTKISSELHDDLGATLSGVKMYGHLMKTQIDPANENAHNSLNTIVQSIGEMISKLNEIVWAINPAEDTFQKVTQKIEDYAQQMCQSKKMELHVSIDEHLYTKQIDAGTRHNLFLICKESINNSVKYSQASKLEIEIKNSESGLNISIHDNGIGFDLNTPKRSNGLINLKKRAEEIDAHLTILTTPGQGCDIQLQVKI